MLNRTKAICIFDDFERIVASLSNLPDLQLLFLLGWYYYHPIQLEESGNASGKIFS